MSAETNFEPVPYLVFGIVPAIESGSIPGAHKLTDSTIYLSIEDAQAELDRLHSRLPYLPHPLYRIVEIEMRVTRWV